MNFNRSQKNLLIVLVLTVFFSFSEFYVHQESGSLIIFNHLMHSIYDIFGILIALFGASFIDVNVSENQSFGYYRYVILAALFNSIFLMLINFRTMFNGFSSLLAENHIHDHDHLISISILGLIVSCISFALLFNNSKSLNTRVVVLHIVRDLFNSFVAIFVSVVGVYYDIDLLDSIGVILVSLFVILGTIKIIKRCIHILCNGSPHYVKGNLIAIDIKENFYFVSDVHHVHIWHLTEDKFISSMHIIISNNIYSCNAIRNINDFLLKKYDIVHNTIQIEKMCTEDNSSCVKI